MIYLDNHATTPCDPDVVEKMLPYFSDHFGNPSSSHFFGEAAASAVQDAQVQVANLLNGRREEIIFTSGATESNNIALLGMTKAYKLRKGARRRIVTTRIEHKSVLAPLEQLKNEGWELAFLPLDRFGQVDLDQAQEVITEDTFLISVQLANSEIGTIQPIASIAEIAKRKGALVHCDASQAVGKIPVNIGNLGVDFLCLSGHKMYGPKGIGVLWISADYKHELIPLMYGGMSSNGIRPGTLPVPLIAGLGKASEISAIQLDEENRRIAKMRDGFEKGLIEQIPALSLNGAKENRLPNNSNITFADVDAEALLANMPEVIASTGSACESGSIEPSRVLVAIGLSREQAFCTIRFGLGRFTTPTEIENATHCIITAYHELQKLLNER